MANKEVQVDLRGIRDRTSKDSRFKELMVYLSTRRRGRGKTSYLRAKRVLNEGGGRNWTYEELDKQLLFLEDAGAADVDRPKNGDLSKAYVSWNCDLKSLSKAALSRSATAAVTRVPPPRLNLPKATDLSIVTLSRDEIETAAQQTPRSAATKSVIRVPYQGLEFEVDTAALPVPLLKELLRFGHLV